MSAYVYRLTATTVALTDGARANVAVLAYKPSWGDEKYNRKMDFESGCCAARRIKAITGRIVIGYEKRVTPSQGALMLANGYWVPTCPEVYDNPRGWRTFYDDSSLGVPGKLPRAQGVTVVVAGPVEVVPGFTIEEV